MPSRIPTFRPCSLETWWPPIPARLATICASRPRAVQLTVRHRLPTPFTVHVDISDNCNVVLHARCVLHVLRCGNTLRRKRTQATLLCFQIRSAWAVVKLMCEFARCALQLLRSRHRLVQSAHTGTNIFLFGLWLDRIRKFMLVKHGTSKREAWIARASIDRKMWEPIVERIPASTTTVSGA